jgi:cell division transport system permease protein
VGRPDYQPVVDKFDETRLDTVDKIGDAQRFITRAGILAGSIFAIISILVIFNTIRMAIFTRSSEITIMRLIGATNSYIRGPFLFESMLYGLVAALVTTSLVYTTLTTLGPKANQHIYFEPTITLFAQYWYAVLGGAIIIGVLIGVVSSSLAMARYMRR